MKASIRTIVRGCVLLGFFAMTACGSGGGSSAGGATIPQIPSVAPQSSVPIPTPSPQPTATAIPAPAGAASAVNQVITQASGGTISSGDASAVFSGSVVQNNTVVQLAVIPANSETPPNGGTSVSTLVQITSAATAATASKLRSAKDDASAQLTVTFPVSSDVGNSLQLMSSSRKAQDATTVSSFTLPLVSIYGNASTAPLMSIVPSFTYNPDKYTISVQLTGNAAKLTPAQQLRIYVVKYFQQDTACGVHGIFAPGLRFYNTTTNAWSPGAPPYNPSTYTHVLFLLHGIFSCVEDTFPPEMIQKWVKDGGYDYVVGYDYNWTANPIYNAQGIADAANGIGVNHFDVYCHSYGGVNAMAMIPLLKPGIKVDNLVAIASPLNGSFVSTPQVYLSALINGAFKYNAPIPLTVAAIAGIASTQSIYFPGNSQLNGLKTALQTANNPTRFIKLVGDTSQKLENTPVAALAPDVSALYKKFTGMDAPPQNDGIVTPDSALDVTAVGSTPLATRGPDDVITSISPGTIIPGAQHTTILDDPTIQTLTEAFIASNTAFSLSNADSSSGVYPSDGAALIMKGLGSRAHFYRTGATTPGLGGTYAISASPSSPVMGSGLLDFEPGTTPIVDGVTPTPIIATIVQNPLEPITISDGIAQPNVEAILTSTYTNGNSNAYTTDFFIFPSCSTLGCPASLSGPQYFKRLKASSTRMSASQRTGRYSDRPPNVAAK